MARWMTRWKPSVGWVSISSVPSTFGRVSVDELNELFAQILGLGCAGTQHFGSGRVVEERKQKMLDGDELMALCRASTNAMCRLTSSFARSFQFSSMTHASGC